jgi:hypothetical protein
MEALQPPQPVLHRVQASERESGHATVTRLEATGMLQLRQARSLALDALDSTKAALSVGQQSRRRGGQSPRRM